ncbi:MAG: divalent-cation tolerance protein CutA [Parvularculaceae bacterium]
MALIVFLYVTAPDEAGAARIAEALIGSRAAACVNILPRITSVYRWRDGVERAEETAMIVKTTAAKAAAARALIEKLHPYETPAIAALPIDFPGSAKKFIRWIETETAETLS